MHIKYLFRLCENPEGEGHKYTTMAALVKVRGVMDRQHSLPEQELVTDPVSASRIRNGIRIVVDNVFHLCKCFVLSGRDHLRALRFASRLQFRVPLLLCRVAECRRHRLPAPRPQRLDFRPRLYYRSVSVAVVVASHSLLS